MYRNLRLIANHEESCEPLQHSPTPNLPLMVRVEISFASVMIYLEARSVSSDPRVMSMTDPLGVVSYERPRMEFVSICRQLWYIPWVTAPDRISKVPPDDSPCHGLPSKPRNVLVETSERSDPCLCVHCPAGSDTTRRMRIFYVLLF